MKNKDIQSANRKAMPKFILMLVICMIAGGAIRFFAAKYELNTLAVTIVKICAFFSQNNAFRFILYVATIVSFYAGCPYK